MHHKRYMQGFAAVSNLENSTSDALSGGGWLLGGLGAKKYRGCRCLLGALPGEILRQVGLERGWREGRLLLCHV